MKAKTQDLGDARWDDARIFLAIVRCRSLGQAARRLGLDTSTVSRRLAVFEASLGVRLFDRARDGITLTKVAEQMVPAAEAMEAGHAQLAREATSIETTVEGVVRLSMPPGEAELFVAPSLGKLRARHPRLRIEIDASSRLVDLTRREADLALRSIAPEGAELVALKLLSARWVVAAAPALAGELGRVRDWNALPWIAWDRDLARFGPSRWLARFAPKAEIALRTSYFGAQLAAARAGVGVVLVPEPHLALHGLSAVTHARSLDKTAEGWPVDHLWLVGHRALRDVPRVAAVWEFLREEVRLRIASSAAPATVRKR